MKKIFKLLVALFLLMLTACGTPDVSSPESEVEPKRTLEISGTAVYFDRAVERRQIHKKHKDLLGEDGDGRKEYVEAMNGSYGTKYYEVVTKGQEKRWKYTPTGRKYFFGQRPDEIDRWLATNPYGLSEAEHRKEKDNYRNALWEGNIATVVAYQQQMVMGRYVDFSYMDKWIQDNRGTLADWNAEYLGNNFTDSSGRANSRYFEEQDRIREYIRDEKFETFLTNDEEELYNFTTDINFTAEPIVYNYDGDYVFSLSRDFSVANPNGGEDFTGTLYIVGRFDGIFEDLDKFVKYD